MRRKQPEYRWFARGPEVIPRPGTRAYGDYENGRRFFEPVLEGQRFPTGASYKELDRLAVVRAAELAQEAAAHAVQSTAQIEQPAPVPSAAMPEIAETIAA